MSTSRDVIDRVGDRFSLPEDPFDRLVRRRDRRQRIRRARAGLLALLISLVAVTALFRAFEPKRVPAVRPVIPQAITSHDSFIDIGTGRVTPLPDGFRSFPGSATAYQISPDGSQIAFSGSAGEGYQIYVANKDGTEISQLTEDPTQASFPRWSPDGTKIVYESGEFSGFGPSRIVVVDLSSREATPIASANGWAGRLLMRPSFDPGGTSVLFTKVGGISTDLWSVPVAGGEATRVLRDASYGSYSPDGKTIAYRPAGPGWWSRAVCFANTDRSDPHPTWRCSSGADAHILVSFPVFADQILWSPEGTRTIYERLPGHEVALDLAIGEISRVGVGHHASWFDEHTLIVDRDWIAAACDALERD